MRGWEETGGKKLLVFHHPLVPFISSSLSYTGL
jgi:hypothetical protein